MRGRVKLLLAGALVTGIVAIPHPARSQTGDELNTCDELLIEGWLEEDWLDCVKGLAADHPGDVTVEEGDPGEEPPGAWEEDAELEESEVCLIVDEDADEAIIADKLRRQLRKERRAAKTTRAKFVRELRRERGRA